MRVAIHRFRPCDYIAGLGPLSFGRVSSVLMRWCRGWRRFFHNFFKHLLPAVVITVLLGAALAAALTLFLMWLVTGGFPAPGHNGTNPFLDVLKVALTVAAGIGGAVALVVAYRRQRHTEVDDAGRRSRYTSAASQLGDPQPAVRLAGVYAMANLADEWAEQRQQCVDVLCAYLRLSWARDPTHLEPNTTTTEHTWPDGTGQRKVTKTYSGRAGEREVRQTLVRVIAAHLQPDTGSITRPGTSWSYLDIDLTNAALPNADFTNANFHGRASLRRATFSGDAYFVGATFSGDPSFAGATFSGDASFDGTTFSGEPSFDGTTFSGDASFAWATFSGDAYFVAATFSGDPSFAGATFSGDASFARATFSGLAYFGGAQFLGGAYFAGATFANMAYFGGAVLSGDDAIAIGSATFSGQAFFDGATFFEVALFAGAMFSGDASFREAQFLGGAFFERAQFSGLAKFAGASLPSRSVFASALVGPSEEALDEAVYMDEQCESPQVPPTP